MIKIEVCLSSWRVREFCIAHQYYTLGDNEAYENLLYNICDSDAFDVWYDVSSEVFEEKAREIAEDIVRHSPYFASHEEMVEGVISNLIRDNMAISVKED